MTQDSENLFLPFCVPEQRIRSFKNEVEKVLKSLEQGAQPADPVVKGDKFSPFYF